MEWTSDELRKYYYVLNKVYTSILKKKFPQIKFILIEPEDFIKKIQSSAWSIDVNVYACISWADEDKNYSSEKAESIGQTTVTVMMNLQNMFEKPSEVGDRRIYPSLKLNSSKYCKGLVPYVNEYSE